ncbi:15091_t:CDS:2 [Funneliformis mosseae]|uniref:15091_t:CDS:1 n=1 Tax=Funneliformis mosseae TaxID=27381 RepID=A0A9N9BRW8_FUNMO|nr:15091_t:CDS:2 [Funneliformis mosseae]
MNNGNVPFQLNDFGTSSSSFLIIGSTASIINNFVLTFQVIFSGAYVDDEFLKFLEKI